MVTPLMLSLYCRGLWAWNQFAFFTRKAKANSKNQLANTLETASQSGHGNQHHTINTAERGKRRAFRGACAHGDKGKNQPSTSGNLALETVEVFSAMRYHLCTP
jgi:hypothetical protein